MIVVDVNVIAYLLIDGEHTEESERLLAAEPHWAAPLLWRSEWQNVLAGYLRRGRLDLPRVAERIDAAASLVSGREYAVDDALVMELVATSSCSAYDCEYAALATMLDVPLVTYDQQLVEGFPDRARKPDDLRT